MVAVLLLIWPRTKPNPGVVLVATWSSNSEQFVTFRLQPSDAVVHFADVVLPTENNPPVATLSFVSNASYFVRDVATPVVQGVPVRYIAMPFEWVDQKGSNQLCTPGSYTVAYTPTSAVNQLRVGVASRQSPFEVSGWISRIKKAQESKNPSYLLTATHLRPVYVKSQPITNFTNVIR